MSIVNRYLLVRSASAFAAILLLLLFVVTAIDATGRIGYATRHEHGLPLLLTMYLLRVPEQIVLLATPALLVAMLVCCAPMLRRSEFVALCAMGVSPRAGTRMLLYVAAAWSVLQFVLVDEVVPPASARAYLIEDAFENQVRDGKCWRVEETGTSWFAAHVRTPSATDLRFSDVAIAPAAGGLLRGDELGWDGRGWTLTGHLRRTTLDADGRYGIQFLDHVDLDGVWRLPFDPSSLHDSVLSDTEMTGVELLRRGGSQAVVTLAARVAQSFAPLLGCLVLLPLYVRFANRDRVIAATSQAFVAAVLPPLALSFAGYSGTGSGPAVVPVIGLFLVAAAPGLVLYWRWRF